MTVIPNSYPRISARKGQIVDLNVDFYHGGDLADPYAIRYVEIYKSQVLPHNLVSVIPVLDPNDVDYPLPLVREYVDAATGDCCTAPTEDQVAVPGKYHLPFTIPSDYVVPDVYFDVWYYFAENPCDSGTDATECDLNDAAYESSLLKCCHRFWVYPDDWACDDKLQTVRFGFEPLDQKFHQPEARPLEIGLMPLPLYDYNFNLVNPMIPFIQAYISVETPYCELLVDQDACRIGIRQGSYRSNPWVIQYDLDTTRFLKGTYRYFITLVLPNGSSRVSRKYIFTVA
jgi:hypothetical protein